MPRKQYYRNTIHLKQDTEQYYHQDFHFCESEEQQDYCANWDQTVLRRQKFLFAFRTIDQQI